ncbi:MAG: hypothetical protein MnENMB40S_15210 [Rhizobiaceae bacterium MnEN-MB40S]|nr:MAG: hypothetical protein MnENMB40S_15210 [Rhizobiaceae bacterium MnEN-MB40S]
MKTSVRQVRALARAAGISAPAPRVRLGNACMYTFQGSNDKASDGGSKDDRGETTISPLIVGM